MDKEPTKELVDSSRNIFGQKGELLKQKKRSVQNLDAKGNDSKQPVCIDIEAEDSETPAPTLAPDQDIVLIDEEESKDEST